MRHIRAAAAQHFVPLTVTAPFARDDKAAAFSPSMTTATATR